MHKELWDKNAEKPVISAIKALYAISDCIKRIIN